MGPSQPIQLIPHFLTKHPNRSVHDQPVQIQAPSVRLLALYPTTHIDSFKTLRRMPRAGVERLRAPLPGAGEGQNGRAGEGGAHVQKGRTGGHVFSGRHDGHVMFFLRWFSPQPSSNGSPFGGNADSTSHGAAFAARSRCDCRSSFLVRCESA